MNGETCSKKIFAIVGESGSGKSTLAKTLCEIHGDLELLVTTTSRPIRDNEVNGVDYNFLTLEEFQNGIDNNKFITHKSFRGWFYGLDKNSIKNTKSNNLLFVTNPYELTQLLDNINKSEYKLIPIYIYSNERIRLLRLLERDSDTDEVFRRLIADREDFLNIPHLVLKSDGHIIKNNRNFEDVLRETFNCINAEMGDIYGK